jgi:hypothetical protein
MERSLTVIFLSQTSYAGGFGYCAITPTMFEPAMRGAFGSKSSQIESAS